VPVDGLAGSIPVVEHVGVALEDEPPLVHDEHGVGALEAIAVVEHLVDR